MLAGMITFEDFEKIDIRVGTVLAVSPLIKAKKPALVLQIDFGPLGILKSSAQIADLYSISDMIGRQVIAVVNFPPKQIAGIMSQCLVLGVKTVQGVVIMIPEKSVENGLRLC
ncbi:MAG: tRNA-binding protein [Saprospiraceae bacterium]